METKQTEMNAPAGNRLKCISGRQKIPARPEIWSKEWFVDGIRVPAYGKDRSLSWVQSAWLPVGRHLFRQI
jgi:hypothetical protein